MFKKLISLFVACAALAAVSFTPAEARADAYYDCTVVEIYEFSNRIHVKCSNAITIGALDIDFIAISTSDAALAARFVSLANAAMLGKKNFSAFLLSSAASNTSGCNSSNCRTPTAFGVQE